MRSIRIDKHFIIFCIIKWLCKGALCIKNSFRLQCYQTSAVEKDDTQKIQKILYDALPSCCLLFGEVQRCRKYMRNDHTSWERAEYKLLIRTESGRVHSQRLDKEWPALARMIESCLFSLIFTILFIACIFSSFLQNAPILHSSSRASIHRLLKYSNVRQRHRQESSAICREADRTIERARTSSGQLRSHFCLKNWFSPNARLKYTFCRNKYTF